ncbi:MAG: hypothetical protein QE279_10155, partial [Rhodoferax sp.]|nr:hypothetical protein [Rhodoferax sp.]
MPAKYANNARSNLFSAINAGALNFSLISGGGASFPAAGGSDYFYATLIDAENIPEIIKVTSRTDDQFVVLRGQDGTVARAFAANAVVLLGITRASLEELALKDGSNATGTWSINTSGNAAMARAANSGVTSGTPTAYTLTPTAAIAAYTANLSFWVTFHSASGANPTLQISGLATPPALVRYNSAGALVGIAAGELPANFSTRVTLLNAAQALVEEMPPAVLSGPSDTALDKRPNFPNASTQIAQRAAFTTNLSTARQIGQCDNIFMWVSAGAVSAGSLTQITSAISGTSGFAARAAGVTLTGSAVLSQSIRMESRDAAKYKNRMASFQV